jgi:hypothetical protein
MNPHLSFWDVGFCVFEWRKGTTDMAEKNLKEQIRPIYSELQGYDTALLWLRLSHVSASKSQKKYPYPIISSPL